MLTSKTCLHTALFLAAFSATTAATISTVRAQHDIRVFMAQSGVKLIEDNLPGSVPTHFVLPVLRKSFTCMDFEQTNTTMDLNMSNVDIVFPSQDRITIYLDFKIAAAGQFLASDIYACFGSATCQDSVQIDRGTAVLDFNVSVVAGEPQVAVRDIQFNVDPENFDFSIDGCGLTGSTLSSALSFTEGWILDYAETQLGTLASDYLGPLLQSNFAGLSMESNFVRASVEDLYFANKGVSVTVDAGVRIPQRSAACVAEFDKGGPSRATGASVPDIQNNDTSNLNMALNLGLVNEALYTAWRKGLMCLSDARLAGLGAKLDLGMAGALLPGFPAGTEFSLDLSFHDYPRVVGALTDGNRLNLEVNGLNVLLYGDRPDGTRNTLRAELSFEATAELGVNPANNSIYARLVGAKITHMRLEDERAATGEGYDVARIMQMVEQVILPGALHDMGPIPLTGAVFEISDYAIMLRSLHTNKAYASVGIDIFKTPNNDSNAPDTRIVSAPRVANLRSGVVRFGGSDLEVPEDVLQYQVTINGELLPLTFMRDIRVGAAGYTDYFDVQVAAVDLAGNQDASPASVTVLVDGIMPFVAVAGARSRDADVGAANLSWAMHDDTSASAALEVRVEIYRLLDPADVLSAQLIETQQLPPGTTSAVVDLAQAGGLYRVEVHVVDEAGNDSSSSLLLASAPVGGCSTTGSSGSSSADLLLLALVAALTTRRRRGPLHDSRA